jgi:hypothetical protein
MRDISLQPTQQRLNELFTYNPDTGQLHARIKKPHRPIGMAIGAPNQSGYLCVEVDKYQERIHRLVWILHYGPIPQSKLVDHINRNRQDNRIENLRLVSPRENTRNHKLHISNKSGITGVYWNSGKWFTRISLHLGPYVDKETAAAARRIARNNLDKFVDAGGLK